MPVFYKFQSEFRQRVGKDPDWDIPFYGFEAFVVPQIMCITVRTMAEMAAEWLDKDMRGPKSGRHWRGLRFPSSAAYETPAYQAYKRGRSILDTLGWQQEECRADYATARTFIGGGRSRKYMYALEFGQPSRGVAPRPMMRAIRDNESLKSDMRAKVRDKVRAIIAKSGARGLG